MRPAGLRALGLAVAIMLVPSGVGAAAPTRLPVYDGYVRLLGGAKTHSSFQGAGWQTVFRERVAGRVRYRVCLTHRPTNVSRCWARASRPDGRSVVFVALFVNDRGGPGAWRATFTVQRRRVATWDFTVLPEPEQ